MHTIASILVAVRGFVNCLSVGIQTWLQSAFSPVHARGVGEHVLWIMAVVSTRRAEHKRARRIEAENIMSEWVSESFLST